jgi:predicted permease
MKSIGSAWRSLYNSPIFAISATLTLSLGIGVNTAIFSVVHAVLLRELPYRDSAQIVSIENPQSITLTGMRNQFAESSSALHSVQGVAAYHSGGVNFETSKETRRLVAAEVSADFLDVMGVSPSVGRGFAADEDSADRDKVLLISERVWREDFGGHRRALGAAVSLNGEQYTVIGVLPAEMDYPDHADLWIPTVFDPNSHARGSGAFYLQFVARLRDGVTIAQAQADFVARAKQIVGPQTKIGVNRQPRLIGLASKLTARIKPALLMLLGTVGFVLAIACANVAGLMIVRLLHRRREIGIRVALGASQLELLKQQGMEALVLSSAGAIIGVALAYLMVNVFYRYFWPVNLLGQFAKPSMDLLVLGYTAFITLASGFCSALAPAWFISRQAPSLAINRGSSGASKQASLLRRGLVVIEVGLAVILLSGAGLLIRTMQNLSNVPLGYDTRNLLTFSVTLRGQSYATSDPNSLQSEAVRSYYAAAIRELESAPDVVSVGAVSNLPLGEGATMALPLVPDSDPTKSVFAELRIASPGYFTTLSVPVMQGRVFPESDSSGNEKAVILSKDLSDQLWPGQNPIGRQVLCPALGKDPYTVLGIVGTSRQHDLRERDALPLFYVSSNQLTWPSMTFVIRTKHDPKFTVELARRTVRSIDKSQPLFDVRTMKQLIGERESLERFERMGLVVFSGLALVLAAIGIYGTISYSVAQRRAEIAIRMALGASRIHTISAILREAGWLAFLGNLSGVAISFYLARYMSSIVFGISPHDPITLVVVTGVLTIIAFMAAYLPAQRAALTDPLKALRSEN